MPADTTRPIESPPADDLKRLFDAQRAASRRDMAPNYDVRRARLDALICRRATSSARSISLTGKGS